LPFSASCLGVKLRHGEHKDGRQRPPWYERDRH
jgi:hypothetical protein